MSFLTELWLPILLSAVFVFVASSVIHMALRYHRTDMTRLPDEDAVIDALRSAAVSPGAYMFPCASDPKDMCSPEMKAKIERGPSGLLTVFPPGGWNLGKSLGQWFGYCLVVSILVAYLCHHVLAPGTAFLTVFRVVGTAAFLGHAVGALQEPIWRGQRWGVCAKFLVDGLVYALVVAGTFGWLWPTATGV